MRDEWAEAPFSQTLSGPVRNGVYKKKEFHGYGVKMVNMGELFANPRLSAIPMKRVYLTESEQDRFGVVKGDLLFARRSLVAEGAGKCCVVLETDEPTTFESSIIRARPDPTKADPLFLYYFFNSPEGLHSLDTIRRQVAVAGITGTDLSQLPVRMPPLQDQRAIAHVLGALDDKIELNRRMNRTLDAMARAVFQDWFVDFGPTRAKMEGQEPYLPPELWDLFPDQLVDSELGEIPEGWEEKPLSEFSSLNPESWSKSSLPENIEYVDLANTKWGAITSTQHFPRKFAPSRARRVLRAGDTIVGTVRPGNGSYSFLGRDDLTGSTGFAVLRPLHHQFRAIVYLAATDPNNIERLANRADGAAYPAVRPEVVAESIIVVPMENCELPGYFSNLVGPVIDKMEGNQSATRTLTGLRDELLPRLLSGELKPE